MSARSVHWYLCLALTAVVIAGCSRVPPTWREEVRLSDGEVVTIQRIHHSNVKSFAVMKANTMMVQDCMRIETPQGELPMWCAPILALVLDRDVATKQWFVIATILSSRTPLGFERSYLAPYLEYRLRDGKWVAQDVAEVHWGRRTNLLLNPPQGELANQLVPADNKGRLNCGDTSERQFHEVYREQRPGFPVIHECDDLTARQKGEQQ
jgi:hypothetical protein